MTDNVMAKRKKKGQTMIHKMQRRRLKIEQSELRCSGGVSSSSATSDSDACRVTVKRQEHHLVFFLCSLLIITESIEIYIHLYVPHEIMIKHYYGFVYGLSICTSIYVDSSCKQ